MRDRAEQLHPGHALLLALALLCLWLGARAVGALVAPPALPPLVRPVVADLRLLAGADPFFPARASDSAALPVTAIALSLHGVRTDLATGRGAAIIAAGNGEQQIFEIGDRIADGVTLAAIAADHVVIDHKGQREALWLDSAGDAPVETFTPDGSGSVGFAGGDAPATEMSADDADGPDVDYDMIDAQAVSANGAAVVPAAPPRASAPLRGRQE